jgi:hypothetical protein
MLEEVILRMNIFPSVAQLILLHRHRPILRVWEREVCGASLLRVGLRSGGGSRDLSEADPFLSFINNQPHLIISAAPAAIFDAFSTKRSTYVGGMLLSI